ncbi:hypothetical protein [Comamonas thiooxydans]|uniref:hypothetical protein n=1 Tax=Comamonas thiooxydans TaxID=363952 RepID=UPI00103D1C2F|nr:hypothetical protein [Comamonas thiooxydans]
MSQYTFTTHVQDQLSTVLTGFCSRTATFYSKLFGPDLSAVPLKISKPLPNETALFSQLEQWGICVPAALEQAIDDDLDDWNFGDGDLKAFTRKFEDFGYQLNHDCKTKGKRFSNRTMRK